MIMGILSASNSSNFLVMMFLNLGYGVNFVSLPIQITNGDV